MTGNKNTFIQNGAIRILYQNFFPPLKNYLIKELHDCPTVLDMGCGKDSLIQHCNVSFSVGVELFESYLQESKKKGIHNEYIKADIQKIEFKEKSFDAVLILDVLEHLSKDEGYKLISKAQRWAKKKVIIFTPNGFLYQEDYEQNPLQIHRAGWETHELEKLGFRVYGMCGWKALYGYNWRLKCTQLRFKPTFLWTAISDITQKITYFSPHYAFELLCVWQKQKEC